MGKVEWTPGFTIDEAEKQCVVQAYRFYRGNKTQTAQSLGISVRTLDTKMERYEQDRKKSQANYEHFREDEAAINERFRGLDVEARNRVLDAERAFQRQSQKPFQAVDSDERFALPAPTALELQRAEEFRRAVTGRTESGLGGDTAKSPGEASTPGDEAGAGVYVEPVDDASEKQTVSVPVGPQVQAVLPEHLAPDSERSGRGSVPGGNEKTGLGVSNAKQRQDYQGKNRAAR